MNLMLSAIEVMNEIGGVLTVKSRVNDKEDVQISVNDTGTGLPVGKAEQVFDAFFTTKPQDSGMGCRSAVRSSSHTEARCCCCRA